MYFLFSGEGATDFGTGCVDDQVCRGNDYDHGPMACVVYQVVKSLPRYSLIDSQSYGFLSKHALSTKVKHATPTKKGMRLAGRKKAKETGYFFSAARALAMWAKEEGGRRDDEVVAVLFRDCDGTASSGRGLWSDKWKSMMDGFAEESFDGGVPMLPKPTSEAWLLCALKSNPYQGCNALEVRSPSPLAKIPLKAELATILNGNASRQDLCDLFANGSVNSLRINMTSFNAFKDRLLAVI